MIFLFYLFIYFNADNIINKLYLSNYCMITNNELIKYNDAFYYSIVNNNRFVLCVYSFYIIKNYIQYNSINKVSIMLSFVYIKYILTVLLSVDMSLAQYETSRNIMWLFSTPLMLKMYCEINNFNLQDINIYYHIIPTLLNVFIYPYKNTYIYYYFIGISWIMLFLFMKNLYINKKSKFTNNYIFIWCIFIFFNIIDIFRLTDIYKINVYYSYADMISKMMTVIIINDFYDKIVTQKNNIDLQIIQFVCYIIKNIQEYKNNNAIITTKCNNYISFMVNNLLSEIPDDKIVLEQELLKKILPFDFDKKYIANANANANAKHFDMICVLFSDIVNYTELAKKYDDTSIFQMLNNIYNTFDNIIKKYPHLQKIETIGDAYMVVGDIFRDYTNHKIVIKEIIMFAIDIVKQIKTIKTPNDIQLSIRVGINIGNVSIGILGNEIPRLCVVGNTVNMTSRLQSTADINTIQLSRHIYEQLADIDFGIQLEIIPKENVFLKNMGSVTTYNIIPNYL